MLSVIALCCDVKQPVRKKGVLYLVAEQMQRTNTPTQVSNLLAWNLEMSVLTYYT